MMRNSITIDTKGLDNIIKKVKMVSSTASTGVNVGWLKDTPPEILARVKKMEFILGGSQHGWAVMRKTKLTIIPVLGSLLQKHFDAGLRGEVFWEAVGDEIEQISRTVLLGLKDPPLKQVTVQIKTRKIAKGLAPGAAQYGASKIFIETGESLAALNHEVVSASEVESSV